MKEDKLKYFYDTLNTAVYPVQELYDNTVKNIPTTRFYEFLEAQKNQHSQDFKQLQDFQNLQNFQGQPPIRPNEEGNPYVNAPYPPFDNSKDHIESEPIKKSDISFNSNDSFEYLPRSEIKISKRPKNIPRLCFDGLPEYETSSDEENDQHYSEVPYQNGYDYINNFYKKVDQQNTKNEEERDFELSSQREGGNHS